MLDKVSETLCANVPKEIMSSDQCSSFVHLYGPYTIDLLYSLVEKKTVCSELGLCSSNSGPEYEVILPHITDQVVYTVRQQNLVPKKNYYYKFFVGNFSYPNEKLFLELLNVTDCEVTIKVTDNYGYIAVCGGVQDRCTFHTVPTSGRWYYFNATVNFIFNKDAEFTLQAIVRTYEETDSIDTDDEITIHIPILLVMPCLILMVCLCCLCCCNRRKRSCKKTTEDEVAIDLQSMPQVEEVPMVIPQEAMNGYYYPHQMPIYAYNMGQQYFPMTPSVPPQENQN